MSRGSDRRRWPVGHDPKREARRAKAAARLADRALRSDEEQLAVLDTRRGASVRERARLKSGSRTEG